MTTDLMITVADDTPEVQPLLDPTDEYRCFVEARRPDGRLNMRVGPLPRDAAEALRDTARASRNPNRVLASASPRRSGEFIEETAPMTHASREPRQHTMLMVNLRTFGKK